MVSAAARLRTRIALFAVALLAALAFVCVSAVPAYAFTARTTSPSMDNHWYFSTDNPYYAYDDIAPTGNDFGGGYVTGNCTWYACGRASEILNAAADLGKYGPLEMWDHACAAGVYETGSTPRVGAVCVGYAGGSPHVSVVEAIVDGEPYVSESSYTVSASAPQADDIVFHYGKLSDWTDSVVGYIYLISESEANASQKVSGKTATIPNGVYTVQLASNLTYALDIAGASTAKAANLQVYTANATAAQQFRFTRNANGTYTITNVNSGRVLSVQYASKKEGANIAQYQANGKACQQWYVKRCADGSYALKNRWSGLYLTLDTTAGNCVNVAQWAGTYASLQKFKLCATPSYAFTASKQVVRQTVVSKLRASTTSIKATWEKRAGVTGYQVRWSTSSSMKNSTKLKVKGASNVSATISGLSSGTTYYVQVRAYKKLNGTTAYAKWSVKRCVRCTKSSTASDIKLSDKHLPKTLSSGALFDLQGKVTSAAKIKSLTAKILDATGKVVQTCTVYPNKRTCYLDTFYNGTSLDDAMLFDALAPGTYTLKITAKTACHFKTLATRAFIVA